SSAAPSRSPPSKRQSSRLLRASRRIVAPTPPEMTKPAPSAAATASGSLGRSLAFTSISERRSSTAPASRSRSASISALTCSGLRPLLVAIALQGLRGQLRLLDRLLGHRRRRLLHQAHGHQGEDRDEQQDHAGDDQQRRPHR